MQTSLVISAHLFTIEVTKLSLNSKFISLKLRKIESKVFESSVFSEKFILKCDSIEFKIFLSLSKSLMQIQRCK